MKYLLTYTLINVNYLIDLVWEKFIAKGNYTMKKLFAILLICTLSLTADISTAINPGLDIATAAESAQKAYWINGNSKKRHNKKCRYYGKTKKGYYTNKAEGVACKICGG